MMNEQVASMPTVTLISHDGQAVSIEARCGHSLMQEAVNHGVAGIVGECGGAAACATCHCYVDDEWVDRLPKAALNERELLECVVSPAPNSRLSCQLKLTQELDGLVVRLPESQY
jgi:2Fe-2S ferredoxin